MFQAIHTAERPQSAGAGLLGKLARAAARFARSEDGPTAVEYAVMLALIIVVCVTAITALGTNTNNTFSYVGNAIGGVAS